MKRDFKATSKVIHLGSAKTETKGAIGPRTDEVLNQSQPGLSLA